jgi:hypothetical protein
MDLSTHPKKARDGPLHPTQRRPGMDLSTPPKEGQGWTSPPHPKKGAGLSLPLFVSGPHSPSFPAPSLKGRYTKMWHRVAVSGFRNTPPQPLRADAPQLTAASCPPPPTPPLFLLCSARCLPLLLMRMTRHLLVFFRHMNFASSHFSVTGMVEQ